MKPWALPLEGRRCFCIGGFCGCKGSKIMGISIWLSGMLWFWSNCFFIFGLVVFGFLLNFSDSNKSICHCISSLFLRFKNLLYFSLLLLPHSVSFCLLILVLPLIFSRVQSTYRYIYILYILYYIHICCLYSGLFSLILRLTSMITLILFIFCCFLIFAYVMFFFVHFPLFCSCLHFPCFPFWIYITTSFWVSSFLLWL